MQVVSSLFLILTLFLAGKLFGQNQLEVSFTAPEDSATIYLELYNADKSFSQRAQTKGGTVVFENIPQGEYAIRAYQDVNENRKLDLGEYGIPAEPYGFSNNAKGSYGPPSFEQCKIEINEKKKIAFRLAYFNR